MKPYLRQTVLTLAVSLIMLLAGSLSLSRSQHSERKNAIEHKVCDSKKNKDAAHC